MTSLPVWAVVVATIITALGGASALRSLLFVRSDRRKLLADTRQSEASAVKLFGEAASALVAPLTERVRDLEARERAAVAEVARLTAEVTRLSRLDDEEKLQLRAEVRQLTLELVQARAQPRGAGNEAP